MEWVFKKIGLTVLLVSILLVIFAKISDAASFEFYPNSGSFFAKENFTVSVMVGSDVPVNAVRGVVNFPTEFLEVIALNGESIVDLWIQKPSFSNAGERGNVRFEGIILNPGFMGDGGKVVNIIFRVKKSGTASLNLSEFSILANDGLGTNVSVPGGEANLSLLPVRAVSPSTPSNQDDFRVVEDKLKSVENKLNSLTSDNQRSGALDWWEVLPGWVRMGAVFLIGITSFILGLIILSFGIVLITWIWGYLLRRRKFVTGLANNVPGKMHSISDKILFRGRETEAEVKGDIIYMAKEFENGFKQAEGEISFKDMFLGYFATLKKVLRRFTTRNSRPPRPFPRRTSSNSKGKI